MPADEVIASATISWSYGLIRRAIGDYQKHMLRNNYNGEQSLRVFAESDAGRQYNHAKAVNALFQSVSANPMDTDNGAIGLGVRTERTIISVIGVLFPKGPFETLLKRDADAPLPIREGLKYQDGFAVFDTTSFEFG